MDSMRVFDLFRRKLQIPDTKTTQQCIEQAESPIPFVYDDGRGRFHMHDQAVNMLQSLTEPIAVVSSCGRTRQGKSFILNQLLGTDGNGFKVASTTQDPCTNGLWLWSSPLKKYALEDGTLYNLLFLDTEAVDAFHGLGTRSVKMVSLAVLLSSMVLYNHMGCIDDVELHLFSFVVEMAKRILVEASNNRDDLVTEQPVLLSMFRDFEDDGSMEDDLERALRMVDGNYGVAEARNKIRESVRGFFPERQCCTLVRPVIDENDLQRLDRIGVEKLQPEFRDGLAALKTTVSDRTRPKRLASGSFMTGPVFVRITQMFLDVLNTGQVPSSWERNKEAECLRVYQSCEKIFMKKFNSRSPGEGSKEALEKQLAISMNIFDTVTMRSGPFGDIYRMCLKSVLERKIVKRFEDKANKGAAAPLHAKEKEEGTDRALPNFGLRQIVQKKNDCGSDIEDDNSLNMSKTKLL